MAMTLVQFREYYENDHDFVATVPDDRYHDHVTPHFLELIAEAGLLEESEAAMEILERAYFRSRDAELRTPKQFMERLGGQYWRLDLHAFAKLLNADPNNPVTQDQFRAFVEAAKALGKCDVDVIEAVLREETGQYSPGS